MPAKKDRGVWLPKNPGPMVRTRNPVVSLGAPVDISPPYESRPVSEETMSRLHGVYVGRTPKNEPRKGEVE